MNRTLKTLVAFGALTALTLAPVHAGKRTIRQNVQRSVANSVRQNTQVRKQILRDARQARLHPSVQRNLRQSFRQDAQRDRLVQRNIHQSLKRVPNYPAYKHAPRIGYRGIGGSGIAITPRGIGYSNGGFSIFFGR